MLSGLAYLHGTARLLHRDIKAGNVLLDGGLGAKIGDFGLVKPVHGPEGKCEQLGGAEALQGAYPYVAPEVCSQPHPATCSPP